MIVSELPEPVYSITALVPAYLSSDGGYVAAGQALALSEVLLAWALSHDQFRWRVVEPLAHYGEWRYGIEMKGGGETKYYLAR